MENMNNQVDEETTEMVGNENIVDKYPGKPGLDDKNGLYRILGSVTTNQVFRRKNAGTNIAPAVGYHVEEIATGRRMLVEKSQGVQLCAQFGMVNAYVVYRTKTKKSKDGEVLKTIPSVYLQPYPARSEAFTQDDKLVTVFKMNAEGGQIKPLELVVEEEQCTPELWRIIMKEYEKGNRKPKRSRRGSEDEHRKMIANLKTALRKSDHIKNPFDM